MRVFRDLETLPVFHNAVITIGSFDGVHVGHQKLIQRIKDLATSINGESVLITFHPHPRLFLYPDVTLQLLTTLSEKIHVLEQFGVDNLVIVPFDEKFSKQTAEEYVLNFLYQKFTPKRIVIGYDHRFGNNRTGDIAMLKSFEEQCGFRVEEIQKQTLDDIAVSSTKIRTAVLNGAIAKANQYLQYPFVISGKVVYGQQVGRTIGFPTANIDLANRHKVVPKEGIYAVRVILKEGTYKGMLYIGNRPTLDDGQKVSIEVNIFDFEAWIYDQFMTIEIIAWIRGDAKFDSLEALTDQLKQDKIDTLRVFNHNE